MLTKVVVLTGSGISAESGIPTFRGSEGLWEGYRVEEVATPEAFHKNPDLVYEFYNERRKKLLSPEVQPNAAHFALAEFERKFSGEFLVVTQNVDDLHERAGSENILHMHGELLKARSLRTDEVFHWKGDLDVNSKNPNNPEFHADLRPHIVWFGEMPIYMDQIEEALEGCQLFVAIGTSGQVYPAAGFVNWVPPSCQKVEINFDDTPVSPMFNRKVQGLASETVPEFFASILENIGDA